MVFFKVISIGSGNVRGAMPKLSDIEVVLAGEKVDIREILESKTDSVEENKNSPSIRIILDRRRNKQLGMGFVVNKSLKVTSTNLLNGRISTLKLTKNDKFESKFNTHWSQKLQISKKNNVKSPSRLFMPPPGIDNLPRKKLPN